jgi:hypothetical protein
MQQEVMIGTITSLLMDDPDLNPQVFQTNNSILRSGRVSATGLPIPVGHNLWVTGHLWVFKPVYLFIFMSDKHNKLIF